MGGELKNAVKGLGKAVVTATALKAASVVNRVADRVNPPARLVRLDAADLDKFLVRHRRTGFALAHAKAFVASSLARGNPHERAAVAERVFKRERRCVRVPRNAVLVVERGSLATAPQLRALAKIAKRDRCSVVLSERPEPEKALRTPGKSKHGVRQGLKRHGFRPGRDRIH